MQGRCFGTLDKGAGEDRRAGKGAGGVFPSRKIETLRAAEGQKYFRLAGRRASIFQVEGTPPTPFPARPCSHFESQSKVQGRCFCTLAESTGGDRRAGNGAGDIHPHEEHRDPASCRGIWPSAGRSISILLVWGTSPAPFPARLSPPVLLAKVQKHRPCTFD